MDLRHWIVSRRTPVNTRWRCYESYPLSRSDVLAAYIMHQLRTVFLLHSTLFTRTKRKKLTKHRRMFTLRAWQKPVHRHYTKVGESDPFIRNNFYSNLWTVVYPSSRRVTMHISSLLSIRKAFFYTLHLGSTLQNASLVAACSFPSSKHSDGYPCRFPLFLALLNTPFLLLCGSKIYMDTSYACRRAGVSCDPKRSILPSRYTNS
jgi:hypothetical protein